MIEKISQYMDAGYPILYMNTFEELKGIKSIIAASGARQVLSWSYAEGLVLYKNGEAQDLYKNDLAKTPFLKFRKACEIHFIFKFKQHIKQPRTIRI